MVDALHLEDGARVLDVGCGKGEILIRVLERWPASGVGIDLSPSFLAEARGAGEPSASRAPTSSGWNRTRRPSRQRRRASTSACPSARRGCWVTSKTLGTMRSMDEAGRPRARRGGLLEVEPPTSEYLDLLGATADDYGSHEDNIGAGACARSRARVRVRDAPGSDWDRYEWTYFSNIERWARAERRTIPRDDAILERGRLGRERYLRGGRDALGFGLYLFRV